MRLELETVLACSAPRAWEEEQKTALLFEVARPLLTYRPRSERFLPAYWEEGETLYLETFFLNLVPLGAVQIQVERVDSQRREIHTREKMDWVRRWDHVVRITARTDEGCLYRDEIEIDAGALTLPLWCSAQIFYRFRQWRWRRLAIRFAEGSR